jgi:hypothetical protein
VAIVSGDANAWLAGIGKADLAANQLVTPDTLFCLSSDFWLLRHAYADIGAPLAFKRWRLNSQCQCHCLTVRLLTHLSQRLKSFLFERMY